MRKVKLPCRLGKDRNQGQNGLGFYVVKTGEKYHWVVLILLSSSFRVSSLFHHYSLVSFESHIWEEGDRIVFSFFFIANSIRFVEHGVHRNISQRKAGFLLPQEGIGWGEAAMKAKNQNVYCGSKVCHCRALMNLKPENELNI